jgi:hypothetical protein
VPAPRGGPVFRRLDFAPWRSALERDERDWARVSRIGKRRPHGFRRVA